MYDLLFNLTANYGAKFVEQISFARLFESVVLLGLIWKKIEPKFEAFEKRLEGIEIAVKDGFHSGEERFTRIEEKISKQIEPKLIELEHAIQRES